MARSVLWLLALGFGGFGAAYAGWPSEMAALTDISLPTPTATIDFAATYGGCQLGFAAFLGLCTRRPPWIRVGLLAGRSVLLGIVAVRLSGLWFSGWSARPVIYLGAAIEVVGMALAFWAAHTVTLTAPKPEA